MRSDLKWPDRCVAAGKSGKCFLVRSWFLCQKAEILTSLFWPSPGFIKTNLFTVVLNKTVTILETRNGATQWCLRVKDRRPVK